MLKPNFKNKKQQQNDLNHFCMRDNEFKVTVFSLFADFKSHINITFIFWL